MLKENDWLSVLYRVNLKLIIWLQHTLSSILKMTLLHLAKVIYNICHFYSMYKCWIKDSIVMFRIYMHFWGKMGCLWHPKFLTTSPTSQYWMDNISSNKNWWSVMWHVLFNHIYDQNIYLSIDLSIDLSIYLSIYRSIYLSI